MTQRPIAKRYEYHEIEEGKVVEFSRSISQDDVDAFAKLTQDYNPLHTDREFGMKSEFKSNIVHGMLAGSLFSTLVGMHCPGEKNLYLTQSLNFKKPILPDSELVVRGEVKSKIDAVHIIVIKTTILCGDIVLIDGEAKVKVI